MREREFKVYTDDKLLDLDWVVPTIKAAYWGGWRTEALIRQSIKASLNFGLYWMPDDESKTCHQVGFARVITDGCTFNWVCDVIIEEKYRKTGLGKFLMTKVLEHPDLQSGVSMLGTRDAHGFYEKLGYRRVEQMKRIPAKK